MKILTLKEFIEMPVGTIFQDMGCKDSRVESCIQVKGDNCTDKDFWYHELGAGWCLETINHYVEWTNCCSRWGMNEPTAIFLVYEDKDIKRLQDMLGGREFIDETIEYVDPYRVRSPKP